VRVPSAEVADRIARTVVSEGLAAGVNIVPGLRSIYTWQGRIEDTRELLLLVKTRGDRVGALEARIRALHPYTVPSVVALPVIAGSAPYLEWVFESVRTRGGGRPDQE